MIDVVRSIIVRGKFCLVFRASGVGKKVCLLDALRLAELRVVGLSYAYIFKNRGLRIRFSQNF